MKGALHDKVLYWNVHQQQKFELNESTKGNGWLSLRNTYLVMQLTVKSVMLFGVIDILFSCTLHLFTSDTMVHHDRAR